MFIKQNQFYHCDYHSSHIEKETSKKVQIKRINTFLSNTSTVYKGKFFHILINFQYYFLTVLIISSIMVSLPTLLFFFRAVCNQQQTHRQSCLQSASALSKPLPRRIPISQVETQHAAHLCCLQPQSYLLWHPRYP